MSYKRECDRCGHQTRSGSLNDKDYRTFTIERRVAQDLCKDCVAALEDWMKPEAVMDGKK